MITCTHIEHAKILLAAKVGAMPIILIPALQITLTIKLLTCITTAKVLITQEVR